MRYHQSPRLKRGIWVVLALLGLLALGIQPAAAATGQAAAISASTFALAHPEVAGTRPAYTPLGVKNQPVPNAASTAAWKKQCAKRLPASDSPKGSASDCPPLMYAPPPAAKSGAAAGTSNVTAAVQAADVTAGLPAGYTLDPVAAGFSSPTKVVFVPGTTTIFVLEKAGVIWQVNNGVVAPKPLLDYSAKTNQFGDRGGLSMMISGTYATDHRLYFYVTNENYPAEVNNCKTASVRYITVTGNTASAVSAPIIGVTQGTRCSYDANGEPKGYSCGTATAADCIPCDDWSHCAGDLIEFGGNICLSTGDGSSYNYVDARALRALDANSLAGKVLCVDKNGNGLTSNPKYAAATPKSNASRYYAGGMRNCFRLAIINGGLQCGNVGWGTWERVNNVVKNSNQGWPCYEGGTTVAGQIGAGVSIKQDDYFGDPATKATCQALAVSAVKAPIFAYNHFGGSAAVALGKPFGANYPAAQKGGILVGDFPTGRLWTLHEDATGKLTSFEQFGAPENFYPVDIETGVDGDLYLVDIGSGQIVHLEYTPSTGVTCPDFMWKATYWPNKDQTGTPVLQQCEEFDNGSTQALNRHWGLGGPAGMTDGWSARYECACGFDGKFYKFTLGSDDGARLWVNGQTVVDNWGDHGLVTQTANRFEPDSGVQVKIDYYENGGDADLDFGWMETTGPTVTIAAPVNGTAYVAGQVITFSGSAKTAAGLALPATAISWSTALVHCYISTSSCHQHPGLSFAGVDHGTTPYPAGDASGPNECYYTILTAVAKDSTGATVTTAVNLPNAGHPDCP